VDISPLEDNDEFKLGRKGAKLGYAGEGQTRGMGGLIFRLAFSLGANPQDGCTIGLPEQRVLELLALAEEQERERKEKEEREARTRPTGLHFIFVNPSAPLPPDFYWGIFLSWLMVKDFLAGWLKVLRSKFGWLPDGREGFDSLSPNYFVCFTPEEISQEEKLWKERGGFTTFRVDFTLDGGGTNGSPLSLGSLLPKEQAALGFIARTANNLKEGGSGLAPKGQLYFGQYYLHTLFIKGIQAERIWRKWLRGGRKEPRVVEAR
jgi:hypothetical protein